MKPKNHRSSRHGHAEPITLMPPNLQMMHSLPFSADEFGQLDAWLAEDGWPAERMDIAMLEGYLVALLVWPIAVSAGALLPPIWGIRGWKVAAKIATPEAYDRFLLLIVGFLQDLERRLIASPRQSTFVLGHPIPIVSTRYFAGSAWATGFMIALHENSAGLRSRSATARSAVEGIAHYASLRSTKPNAMASVAADLAAAVATLMDERPSRGVFGPLTSNLTKVARVA
jgi:yecA family protein